MAASEVPGVVKASREAEARQLELEVRRRPAVAPKTLQGQLAAMTELAALLPRLRKPRLMLPRLAVPLLALPPQLALLPRLALPRLALQAPGAVGAP